MANRLEDEAVEFLSLFYEERCLDGKEARIRDVCEAIRTDGTYEHTAEELAFGARLAWRNSNRCIGRLFWERLTVIDEREARTEEAVAQALFRHIEYATNGGKVIPTITVFKQGASIRIWNAQLVRYAGYRGDGRIIGDPASLELTDICKQLGWVGAGGDFDVLPLVISVGARPPQLFPIPEHLIKEVALVHPDNEAFARLNLKWYAVPFISNMRLEIGGISYYAAPFNGWYMGTEIGARNLADDFRYNRLPEVAAVLGISMEREASLWRDQALVELNRAVLYSYQEQGVSIVDHHTAAKQFQRFICNETEAGRGVTGDWTWLIPPMSPAQTDIFHQSFDNRIVSPNYFQEKPPYCRKGIIEEH